jgi:DNA-binding NtrC family response regulator
MSGMDVLRELAARWPEICVIMVSAVADLQTAIDTMKQGAYDYVTKPFNQDDLVSKIKRALEKRDLKLENERHMLQLQQRIAEQTKQTQTNFAQLVETLAREHSLLFKLTSQKGSKSALSALPKELQDPKDSVEEFREALIKILRRGNQA